MMMSPVSYYEVYLKGKTSEQIMTEIRQLKKEIGHLKKVMEDPYYDRLIHMRPDEHTQLSCTREYLVMAKLALMEAGGEYTPSKSELKADEFDESIPSINKVVFSIGGYSDGHETRTITFDDKHLYMSTEHSLRPKLSDFHMERDRPMTKAEFLDGLYKLHIGEWRKRYDDNDILDGTQWDLEIYFCNDHKPVKIYGSNAYPYNFCELLDLLNMEEWR